MNRLLLAAVLCMAAVTPSAQTTTATLTLTTKPSPLLLGQNRFDVTLTDARGKPIDDAEVALLLLMPANPKTKHPEMRTEGTLNRLGNGKYNGLAMVTMAGDWDVTVTATQKGKQIAQKKQRMTVHLTRPKSATPQAK